VTGGNLRPGDVDTATGSAGEVQSKLSARTSATVLRAVLSLARIEALLLARSVLVLAGLVAGGAFILYWIYRGGPLWWNTAWEVGYGQLILAMAVLISAHLATGRARRDSMEDLYGSFPTSAGTRTLAHLAALAGAALPSLLLIGAATITAGLVAAAGSPSVTTLAAGLLLVIAAGAVGVAVGTRFPHPMAGIVAALALLLIPFSESNSLSSAIIWLYPWTQPDQLWFFPGPVPGYPPAGAHAVVLAGLAVLAGIVALTVTAQRARLRAGLAAAGVLTVAVICLAEVVQLQPIPTADLNHLVSEVADPPSVQHCTTHRNVQYCLYPGFGVQLPTLETAVDGVLAHVPALPARRFTIAQVATIFLSEGTLTDGHSKQQLAAWSAQLRRPPRIPANASPALTIDEYVGSWPVGASVTVARFIVALGAAEWAVNLPPSSGARARTLSTRFCAPVHQAREAIAIWMAIQSTQPSPAQVKIGLAVSNGFDYPNWGNGTGPFSLFAPRLTYTGTLLAEAMMRLPRAKVAHVLKASWSMWLNWHTTEAQLAAALGIPLPRAPVEHVQTSGGRQPPPTPLCKT
jgi:hypothetical protein